MKGGDGTAISARDRTNTPLPRLPQPQYNETPVYISITSHLDPMRFVSLPWILKMVIMLKLVHLEASLA